MGVAHLTGCQLSEIQFLPSEYVKDDCIKLRDANTRGRVVPLGPEVRAVLASPPREEDDPWISFHSERDVAHIWNLGSGALNSSPSSMTVRVSCDRLHQNSTS